MSAQNNEEGFGIFPFSPALREALDAMNFRQPTPIQQQAIPHIIEGRDLIACAQTGTGKTAAFLLPILSKLSEDRVDQTDTLILVPTRELAQQIDQQVDGFSYFSGVSSMAIYGGGDGMTWDQQKKALDGGADIIIATPGRLLSFLTLNQGGLSAIKHLVLDEADRMLDMGFNEDILRIVSHLPAARQTLLFSATMPPRIRELARRILRQPIEISIAVAKPAEGIRQLVYVVNEAQKEALLHEFLKEPSFETILIFASTRETVKKLGKDLRKAGVHCEAFHSDLEQAEREEIMRNFRSKKLQVLIGTDVLSRGIDVEGISMVLNYDVPPDPEDYVHRVGRTARASTTGTAITLVNVRDRLRMQRIEKLLGKRFNPEPLSEAIAALSTPDPVEESRDKGPKSRHRKPRKRPGA